MITNTKTNTQIPLVIVAGMSNDTHTIGKENGLLWHVPADMKRFKSLTLGHPVIMGRKTFESIVQILGKPLPGRTNIVVTRNSAYTYPGTVVALSLAAAYELALLEQPSEIHIGGGSELYHQALPLVDKLYLTFFDDAVIGDVFFPAFKTEFTEEMRHGLQEYNELHYEWVDYIRTKEQPSAKAPIDETACLACEG